MSSKDWIAANAGYARELMLSAWSGASSAWQASPTGDRIPLRSGRDGGTLLATTAIGLATGIVSGLVSSKRMRGRGALIGGIAGGCIAAAGTAAWGMRTVAGRMAKGAARGVEDRRNLHWLEHNPINYA